MKTAKRVFCTVLCFVIFAVSLCLEAPICFADSSPVITVSACTAIPQDTVAISISMENNPGIMAMTFTVLYDTQALEYTTYSLGYLNDRMIVDHPEKGYISIVSCESYNIRKNGVILTLMFKVKDNAPAQFHPITIGNIRPERYGGDLSGCFANWAGTKILMTAINGGVTVGKCCLNGWHKFSDWETVAQAACETAGTKSRSCNECGHTEMEEIPPCGHDYDDFWTIDRAAAKGVSGIMSRHCKRCTSVKDKVYFSLPDAIEQNFNNAEETTLTENDWDELKKDNNIPEATPVPNENTVKEPEDTQSGENTTYDTNSTAQEIIYNVRKQSNGIAGRLYRYFVGNNGRKGIIKIIVSALPQRFKKILGDKNLILSVIAAILLI